MKTQKLIPVVIAALLLGGCIPSVNPFYSGKDLVFDEPLLGEWQEKDAAEQPETWKFEKADDNAYTLTTTDKDGKRGRFTAHLFRLKQELFLDLIPSDCEYATNQADLVAFSMFPGHLLLRLAQAGPELKLAMTDFDWLEKVLGKNPKALAHHLEDKRIILTAATRDLQRFVLKHLAAGELFEEPGTMVRKPNPPAQ